MTYYIIASTKWSRNRMGGVSADITELIEFFRDWADKHELSPRSIWYADVFCSEGHKRIGSLELLEDRNVIVDIDYDGSRLNRWKRLMARFR